MVGESYGEGNKLMLEINPIRVWKINHQVSLRINKGRSAWDWGTNLNLKRLLVVVDVRVERLFSLHGNICKEEWDGLSVVGSSNCFSDNKWDIDNLERNTKTESGLRPVERWKTLLFTLIFGHSLMCFSCGIVFVTTTASKQALLIREIAGPEKIPCVGMA